MLCMKNQYYRCQKTKNSKHMSSLFLFLFFSTFNNTLSFIFTLFPFISKHWFITLRVFKINKYCFLSIYTYIDAIPDNSNPQTSHSYIISCSKKRRHWSYVVKHFLSFYFLSSFLSLTMFDQSSFFSYLKNSLF